MKLRNKLIPLLSVVASTTVVAPIVTSCGQSMEMVDITKNYIPSIDKAKEHPEGLTDVEAQDLYFEDVAKNSDVIKQDILKYEADRLPARIKAMEYPNSATVQEWISTNVIAQVGVSGVSARKVTANIEGKEVFFYALSANIKYVTQFKFLSMDGTKEEIYDQTFSMTLKDIPTEIYSEKVVYRDGSAENHWFLSNQFVDPDGEPTKKLSAVPGWCYSFEETHTNTYNTRTETGEVLSETTSSNDSGAFNRIDQITNLINAMSSKSSYMDKYLYFQSYHLNDVAVGEEGGGTKPATVESGLNVSEDGTINGTWTNISPGTGTYIEGCPVDLPFFVISSDLIEKLNNAKSFKFFVNAPSIPTTLSEYDIQESFVVGNNYTHGFSEVFEPVDTSDIGTYYIGDDEEDGCTNIQLYSHSDTFNSEDGGATMSDDKIKLTIKLNSGTSRELKLIYNKANGLVFFEAEYSFAIKVTGSFGYAYKTQDDQIEHESFVLSEPTIYVKLTKGV